MRGSSDLKMNFLDLATGAVDSVLRGVDRVSLNAVKYVVDYLFFKLQGLICGVKRTGGSSAEYLPVGQDHLHGVDSDLLSLRKGSLGFDHVRVSPLVLCSIFSLLVML